MDPAANAATLEEMDRKLKLSDQELDIVDKWLNEAQGKLWKKMCAYQIVTVCPLSCWFCSCCHRGRGLKGGPEKTEAEAAEKRTAAERAVSDLEQAKHAAKQHESRVTEVQGKLKDGAENLEALEKGRAEQSSHLSKVEKEL